MQSIVCVNIFERAGIMYRQISGEMSLLDKMDLKIGDLVAIGSFQDNKLCIGTPKKEGQTNIAKISKLNKDLWKIETRIFCSTLSKQYFQGYFKNSNILWVNLFEPISPADIHTSSKVYKAPIQIGSYRTSKGLPRMILYLNADFKYSYYKKYITYDENYEIVLNIILQEKFSQGFEKFNSNQIIFTSKTRVIEDERKNVSGPHLLYHIPYLPKRNVENPRITHISPGVTEIGIRTGYFVPEECRKFDEYAGFPKTKKQQAEQAEKDNQEIVIKTACYQYEKNNVGKFVNLHLPNEFLKKHVPEYKFYDTTITFDPKGEVIYRVSFYKENEHDDYKKIKDGKENVIRFNPLTIGNEHIHMLTGIDKPIFDFINIHGKRKVEKLIFRNDPAFGNKDLIVASGFFVTPEILEQSNIERAYWKSASPEKEEDRATKEFAYDLFVKLFQNSEYILKEKNASKEFFREQLIKVLKE